MLLEVSPGGRHSKDRLRQRSEPYELMVAYLIIGTIYRVDRAFRKLLAVVFGDGTWQIDLQTHLGVGLSLT